MKNFDTRKTQSQGEGGDRATGSSGRRAPMIGQDLIEMTEGPVKPAVNGSFRLDTPVEALASHALQSIVKIRSKGSEARAQLVDRLLRASRNVDASDAHSLIDNLMGEGVELGEMIDYYIPEVARRLGQAWCMI